MPGKSRKVAARQSQLNRRKKKQQRGPSGIPSADDAEGVASPRPAVAVAASTRAPDENSPDPEMGAEGEGMAVAATPAPGRRSAPATSRPTLQTQTPNPGRSRRDRPAAYQYVGSELRRILVMSTVVVAAIVGLSFVL